MGKLVGIIVILAVLIVAVLAGVYLVTHYFGQAGTPSTNTPAIVTHVVEVDEKGRKTAPSPLEASAGPATPAGSVAPAPSAGPDQAAAGRPGPITDAPPPADVPILQHRVVPSKGAEPAFITGLFRNETGRVLKTVTIEVVLSNPQGAIKIITSRPYPMLPPDWLGHFSLEPEINIEEGGIAISRVVARAESDATRVGWKLADYAKEITADGKLTLTGMARNPLAVPVQDAVLLADFYTALGRHVGTAKGSWRFETPVLNPNQQALYEIVFDPIDAGIPAVLIEQVEARLVGRPAGEGAGRP